MPGLFLAGALAMLATLAQAAPRLAPITVTSPAFAAGSVIPRRYSAYGGN